MSALPLRPNNFLTWQDVSLRVGFALRHPFPPSRRLPLITVKHVLGPNFNKLSDCEKEEPVRQPAHRGGRFVVKHESLSISEVE